MQRIVRLTNISQKKIRNIYPAENIFQLYLRRTLVLSDFVSAVKRRVEFIGQKLILVSMFYVCLCSIKTGTYKSATQE